MSRRINVPVEHIPRLRELIVRWRLLKPHMVNMDKDGPAASWFNAILRAANEGVYDWHAWATAADAFRMIETWATSDGILDT